MKISKIVCAPDSMKGSLSASDVARHCCEAARRVLPWAETVAVPLADGGEGTVDALVSALGGEMVECTVSDPLGRPVKARYGVVDNGRTAVMEMAAASGLPLVEEPLRNPMKTSTEGTGQMMLHAMERGCRKLLLGIGGSATVDGGTGMLTALGYRMLDACLQPLAGTGANLRRIALIDASGACPLLADTEITVACDVVNPLCGPDGAAAVFGPQKGATPAMVAELDSGLANLAAVMERMTGRKDVAAIPGAGAAGGLGAALTAVLGARLTPGIDMVLDAVGFDTLIADVDLVITGEGRLDRQTAMGKTPSGVLKRCQSKSVPVVAIGGSVTCAADLMEAGFAAVLPIVSGPMSLGEAMRHDVAAEGVERTVEMIVRLASLSNDNKHIPQP